MRKGAAFVGLCGAAILCAAAAAVLATCCGTNGAWGVELLGVRGAVTLARARAVQPYESLASVAFLTAALWLAYAPAAAAGEARRHRRRIAWTSVVVTAALLFVAHSHRFGGEVRPYEPHRPLIG